MKVSKLFLFCMAVLLLAACSKTVMENKTAVEQQPEPVVQVQPEQQEPAPAPEPQVVADDALGRDEFLSRNIYFDFDSAVLNQEAQSLLQIKAQWLRDNPAVVAVMIQGHCDERGTEAYNMALGAKRADAVRKFLDDLGLSMVSFETQSFGEEKPVDSGHSEAAWAKNRRASFVIN